MSFLIPAESFSLERAKLSVRKLLEANPDLLDAIDLQTRIDEVSRAMVLELRTYVYTEKLPPETVTASQDIDLYETKAVPDGPWQRFLERHIGAWWTRLWPSWKYPRYNVVTFEGKRRITLTVTVQRHLAYPESQIGPVERLGQPIRGYTTKTRWEQSHAD